MWVNWRCKRPSAASAACSVGLRAVKLPLAEGHAALADSGAAGRGDGDWLGGLDKNVKVNPVAAAGR